MILRQPTGLSKEASLYAGADWLKLICQSQGGMTKLKSCVNVEMAVLGFRSQISNMVSVDVKQY